MRQLVAILREEKDACYRKVKSQYKDFPSARASQAIAKCRKASGDVRKSEKGADLKRWQDEKWVDTKTGEPCGDGGDSEYCRPTRKVSGETPATADSLTSKELKSQQRRKSKGLRAKMAKG